MPARTVRLHGLPISNTNIDVVDEVMASLPHPGAISCRHRHRRFVGQHFVFGKEGRRCPLSASRTRDHPRIAGHAVIVGDLACALCSYVRASAVTRLPPASSTSRYRLRGSDPRGNPTDAEVEKMHDWRHGLITPSPSEYQIQRCEPVLPESTARSVLRPASPPSGSTDP
jgi:hypothetical protein